MALKYLISNFIKKKKYIFKIHRMLISSLSFVNNNLMISMFSLSIALCKAVLLNNIKISFNYRILNFIEKHNFKFYLNILF